MLTLVIYDSKFGNTERVAQAIARGAGAQGTAQLLSIDQVAWPLAERPDLILLGGPTQRRGLSPGLRAFVDGVRSPSLQGIPVASFDTRYRGATLLMGSAAREAARRLERAGGRLASPPESFYIGRGGPLERQTLEAGELERAEAWGRAVASRAGQPAAAMAG